VTGRRGAQHRNPALAMRERMLVDGYCYSPVDN